ncbi:hypothetical protein PTSG_03448 [Salpingoeca rosetta]|uniref:Uncharacterized protein n=1 Tax=Salpingoeca rosetta (strain ATCC 50818 / BSB-021) TaxID=946362 RepID=F2U582_SALR5|nr:uncharacterized protein PTSG_03448 [Salpingoeca rosetta]EGD82798.1 hypothetical protein PTSG_03448 [Salpingoeca rosetta]|eukprot:XP_004996033.1 hypothetical protein PTSG_03448 [Salpingoeca rosetta]
MFPRRDVYGTTQLHKPFRAHEPDPRTIEAVHQVPRESNVRLTASSKVFEGKGNLQGHNPHKITASQPYSAKSPRKRRQLPPTPSTEALSSRIHTHKVPVYDKKGPIANSTTHTSTFEAPRVLPHVEISDRTIRPLSQNVQRSSFRDDPVERSGDTQGRWNTDHGYSERDNIGQLPLTVVGEDSEQISAWRRSQDLIKSLRVSDAKAEDPWWTPRSTQPESRHDRATTETDDLPDVFVRLTDHKRYNGTHKHRFSQDGVGLGLEGRREDDHHRHVLAGEAKITRDLDVEMDAPNKPTLPWETPKTSRPVSRSSTSRSRSPSKESVFERLSKPTKRKQDLPDGDYEIKMKVMNDFGVNKDLVAKWQAAV